jgi:transcriptional regulator with XRE-family HTH domain
MSTDKPDDVSMERTAPPGAQLRTTLPQTLAKVRGLRGMSMRRLALESGVAKSTICDLESGQATDVMMTTLCKLCGVLRVTPDYLLNIYPDETLASASPVVEPPTVRESRTCAYCSKRLRAGEPHMPGECMMHAADHNPSAEYLAAKYGFCVAAIAAILAAEYDRRNHKTAEG